MKIRHAFSGHVYEDLGDGLVKVTDPATGKDGVFTAKAQWQSGELTDADFHLCGAVAGPKAAFGFDGMAGAIPSDAEAKADA